MAVIALSGDYVNAVQQGITSLYGSNNIGVTTPKAIIKTIQDIRVEIVHFKQVLHLSHYL